MIDRIPFQQVSLTVDNDRNVTTTNIFVSPLSVWTLLALLSEGAEGETLREILEVMSVQDQNLIKHHFKSFQETVK